MLPEVAKAVVPDRSDVIIQVRPLPIACMAWLPGEAWMCGTAWCGAADEDAKEDMNDVDE